MFDPEPELSPDIEWMLRSGQASPQTLAHALLSEYGTPLYRFCLSLLDDEQAAHSTICAVMTRVLLNMHRYQRGSVAQNEFQNHLGHTSPASLRTWLFNLVLDQIGRMNIFGVMPTPPDHWSDFNGRVKTNSSEMAERVTQATKLTRPRLRLAACLYYLHDCSTGEIANLIRTSEASIQSDLEIFRQNLIQSAPGNLQPVDTTGLDAELKELCRTTSAGIFLSEKGNQNLVGQAITQAGRLARRQKFRVSLLEAALIIVVILVVGGIGLGFNQLLPATEATSPVVYHTVLVTQTRLASASIVDQPATPSPENDTLPILNPEDVIYTVQAGDTLASISARFGGVSPKTLLEINRLAVSSILKPGQRLLLPVNLPEARQPSATLVDQADFVLQETPEGPARSADLPAIYRRFRWFTSGWQTLWVDAIFSDFGPSGELSPPNIVRVQAWLSGNQLLALSGVPGGHPTEVLLALFDENQYFIARPEKNLAWFEEISPQEAFDSPLVDAYLTRLLNPFYPGARPGTRSFSLAGIGKYKDREVEIVEEYQSGGELTGRIIIDRQGGLILHSQKFFGENPKLRTYEIVVDNWRYDVDFPQALFNALLPWRGGFAKNFHGGPEEPLLPIFPGPIPAPSSPGAATGVSDPALGSQSFY